jgi:Ca-activated chloride channel family protein
MRLSIFLGVLLFAFALLVPATRAADPQNDAQQPPTISVDVKLVNVFATVTDAHGAPVSTLTKGNFALSEDGVPQTISVFSRESQLPLSIVMAIDASLSTKKDLKLELASARRFAHEILRPQDSMSLCQFSELVEELVPFTSDLKRIDAGIDRVHVRSATAMYDAIYLGSEALLKRQGRKVMVIITDGGDTMSSTSYQEALRAAQQAEATVYSLIMVPIEASAGRDLGGEHALIQLSHDTGGKYFYADTLPRLERAFEQISDELRTQYLLAYYPARRLAESDFRKIKIELQGPGAEGLKARHRTGYYTSKFK